MLTERPGVRIGLGALLVLLGTVWALQGIGVFPGESFMNDQGEWIAIGAAAVVLGAWLAATGLRARG
ncbi:MAG: hypothetical protein H0U10_12390 [Chloroflexia bacterium]|nr:hypothetical protein [Chloroflexia bacterium]